MEQKGLGTKVKGSSMVVIQRLSKNKIEASLLVDTSINRFRGIIVG